MVVEDPLCAWLAGAVLLIETLMWRFASAALYFFISDTGCVQNI